MAAGLPPKFAKALPQFFQLPAGTFLWKVFRPSRSTPAGSQPALFRCHPPATALDQPGAPSQLRTPGRSGPPGRFDPTPEEGTPFCYAAFDDLTALCEALLRDVRFDTPRRYLPRRDVADRSLLLLETVRPLWLVSLRTAADLAAGRQDTWLVHAEAPEYALTRLWAQWLRDSIVPETGSAPDGLVWPAKRQPTGHAVLFCGERAEAAVARSPLDARPFDGEDGLRWLNNRLSLLNTRIAPAAAAVPPSNPPPAQHANLERT